MEIVPFYANTQDDLHCYQASLRVVLKYFMPEKNFTFRQLDRMTGQKKGKWTWSMQGLLSLQKMGFQIVNIEQFDYQRVANDVEQYLIEVYGEETAKEQISHSDIPSVQKDAREFIRKIHVTYRIPEFEDIQKLLEEGYLIGCLVNSKALNGKTGYVGHFIIVYRCTPRVIFFHDPGLPPMKSRRASLGIFEKAWAFPDEKAKNILAFRYSEVARKD